MSEPNAKSNARSRGLLLAGAFAGAVALALVVTLIATFGGSTAPGEPPGGAAGSRSPAPEGSPSGAGELNHQVPSEPPGGVRWDLYHGFAVPYSGTAGPYRVEGARATGYAHTPTGALIAGVQIYARALLSEGDRWESVVRAQVVPNEGRETYITNRSEVTSEVSPGQLGQIAGFRFVSYTDRTAVIQYVSRFPSSGELQVTTYTLRWSDDTWKLVLQPDGGFSPTAQKIQDLTRFVPWGGV